jgi:hypothetical protein
MAEVAVTPVDKPLALGELFAETTRIYRERFWAAIGLGAVAGIAFIPAAFIEVFIVQIVVLAGAFTAAYAAATRLAAGDALGEAFARTLARAPVLAVLMVAVAVPFAIGRLDPIILFVSVFWLALTGFSIPVAMLERADEEGSWIDRLGGAMRRSLELARAHYLHAAGVIAALVLVYVVAGNLLAIVLAGFADNSGFGALLLVQLVLAPFFFLGLAVLYFEQRARLALRTGAHPTAN